MPLSDLAAALAAATGPSRELDERMAVEVFGLSRHPDGRWRGPPLRPGCAEWVYLKPPAYTSDLNAITGAICEKWPGAKWSVDSDGWTSIEVTLHFKAVNGDCATPCIALCLAAVRLAMAEEGR